MPKKEIAVIGLGSFGENVVRTLVQNGATVLAIDKSEENVNKFVSIASVALIADSTDEAALKELGIRNFDHVVVAIGQDRHASILTTLILKDLGVENITVKASDEKHEKILKKIGATHTVYPERDMGLRIAHRLMSDTLVDIFELGNKHSIVHYRVNNPKITDVPLVKLNLIKKYKINISAIKRDKEIIIPQSDTEIKVGDVLIIIGENTRIHKFSELL